MPRAVVSVAGVRKTYGKTVAVDDVSFEVQDGEIFGFSHGDRLLEQLGLAAKRNAWFMTLSWE